MVRASDSKKITGTGRRTGHFVDAVSFQVDSCDGEISHELSSSGGYLAPGLEVRPDEYLVKVNQLWEAGSFLVVVSGSLC